MVDAGAAEKYYKVIWNNPDEFKDVIIHLGDFHAFMHPFSNCGKFVTNSGFEEIVYQSRMCSGGGKKPVLSGKSYTVCLRIHEVVAEAISRLFQEQYDAPFISKKLVEESKSDHTTLKNAKGFEEYYAKYAKMQNRFNVGESGVTAKYWMLYVRIIDLIRQLHFAININDYYLRLETWEELMVLSFTMNRQNYAGYGTYYLTQMGSLDSTNPGAHEEIQGKGISVCRNNTGVRQSINGTGEQNFMRNSRTAGNYISFLMCSGCSSVPFLRMQTFF